MNPHANDGATAGGKAVICGDCLRPFYGKTPQAAADRCRAHVEAGCPKARLAGPQLPQDAPNAVVDTTEPESAEAMLWG